MPFFETERKTAVGTSVSRVVADKYLPTTLKSSLLMATLKDGSPSEYMLGALASGIVPKVDRMYAKAKTTYPTGLPSKSTAFLASSETAVQAAIVSIFGAGTTLDYYHFGPLNLLHYAWTVVLSQYGYDEKTNLLNVLTASKGTPVYLHDLVPIISDATVVEITNGSLDFWGTSPTSGVTPERIALPLNLRPFTPFVVQPGLAQDYVRMFYMYKTDKVYTDKIDIPIPITTTPDDLYQIRYRKGGLQGYYTYKVGTGQPALDAIFSTAYPGTGDFFPNIYFRKKSAALPSTDPSYKSSVELTKIIGIDFDDVSKSIASNKDVQYVDQAMLSFVVPANTLNKVEQKYLFDFFNLAYINAGGSTITQDEAYNGKRPNVLVIQDRVSKCALGFEGIFKEIKGGTIGKIGASNSALSTVKGVRIAQMIKSGTFTGTDSANVNPYSIPNDTAVFIYQRQVTDTTYEELQVINLKMAYDIKNGYSTVGKGSDPFLLVPLDKTIVSKYSMLDREMLYSRSMHFIFNTYQTIDIEWYQKQEFSDFLMVVAIIITICDWGSDGGSLISAVSAASGATATLVALYQLAINILLYILEKAIQSAIIGLFIDAVGIKVAFILAIGAALYGGYKIIQAGSVKGAPWAKELLTYSTGLTSGINTKLSLMYKELGTDYSTFEEYKKEKLEELETTNNLLESSNLLNPLFIPGELPKNYFERTIHAGNIGVASMDAMFSYVDVALTLPSFAESIES